MGIEHNANTIMHMHHMCPFIFLRPPLTDLMNLLMLRSMSGCSTRPADTSVYLYGYPSSLLSIYLVTVTCISACHHVLTLGAVLHLMACTDRRVH